MKVLMKVFMTVIGMGVLVILIFTGCTYEATCWVDGVEVYYEQGITAGKPNNGCPKKLDKDYIRLPNGEVIQGRCECWIG